MKELFILLGIAAIFIAPIVAVGWIIYRAVKGSNGDRYSIK